MASGLVEERIKKIYQTYACPLRLKELFIHSTLITIKKYPTGE
jgi:hypothetical protein